MTPVGTDDREQLLDAYVDGLLTASEREAFERRAGQDAVLRRELDTQRTIDGLLRGGFAPPSADRVVAQIELAAQSQRVVARFSWSGTSPARRVAIAAVLALGVLGIWRIWDFVESQRPGKYPARVGKPMHETYADVLAKGFRPDWVCKTDREFAETFKRRLGQPLLLAKLPEGVQAFGLWYPSTITPRTVGLLAKAGDAEILVFADRTKADKAQSLPPASGLHLFRREIDGIVLYELSPLTEAHLLDAFYIPDRLP
jgi:hypothetical protein